MSGTKEQCNARSRASKQKLREDPERYAAYVAKYTAYNQAKAEEQRLYMAAARAADPEKYKEIDRQYRLRYPERVSAKNKAYHEKHKERLNAAARQWKLDNAEHVKQSFKDWVENNRELMRSYGFKATLKRRAFLNDSPPLTSEMWESIFTEFEGTCAYCDDPANTLDHVLAVSQGGGNQPENCVPACRTCNSSKGKKSLTTWLSKRRDDSREKVLQSDHLQFMAYRDQFFGSGALREHSPNV